MRSLNSLKNILSEQSRIYRAMINGVISTSEGTRLVFVLKEIRCTREAIDAANAVALAKAEAAAATATAEPSIVSINVTSIPSGHFLQADGSFAPMTDSMLQLAPPEPEPQPVPEAAPVEETAPQTPEEEEQLIVRLKSEVNALARRAGLSIVV